MTFKDYSNFTTLYFAFESIFIPITHQIRKIQNLEWYRTMTNRLNKNKSAFTTVDAVATIENSALRCAEEGDNEKAAHFFYAAAIEAEKHNIDPKHIIILWRDAGNCFYRSMKFVQGIKALDHFL